MGGRGGGGGGGEGSGCRRDWDLGERQLKCKFTGAYSEKWRRATDGTGYTQRDVPNLDAPKGESEGRSSSATHPSRSERGRRRREGTSDAGTCTGGAGDPAGGATGGAGGAGAAGAGDRGTCEGRQPGARAGGNGAQDAVERHGEADPGPEPDPPPRQGLGEAGARPQGPHAARPLPGARQEAPRHPHQEDQGPVRAYFMRRQEDYRYSMLILIHTKW